MFLFLPLYAAHCVSSVASLGLINEFQKLVELLEMDGKSLEIKKIAIVSTVTLEICDYTLEGCIEKMREDKLVELQSQHSDCCYEVG